MNRHHYGLYIHGGKLVLLLRKEAEDVKSPEEMQAFRPAEFRWKIPHVTDDKWHHYTLNVDFQQESSDAGVSLEFTEKFFCLIVLKVVEFEIHIVRYQQRKYQHFHICE